MASNTNASLIKYHKALERPTIPAHILNIATIRIPLNNSIYQNYISKYTFDITEAFRLTEISLQPPTNFHNNNRSGG